MTISEVSGGWVSGTEGRSDRRLSSRLAQTGTGPDRSFRLKGFRRGPFSSLTCTAGGTTSLVSVSTAGLSPSPAAGPWSLIAGNITNPSDPTVDLIIYLSGSIGPNEVSGRSAGDRTRTGPRTGRLSKIR